MLYGPRCSLFVGWGASMANHVCYRNLNAFSRLIDLARNRCKVVNDATSERLGFVDLATLEYSRGLYRLRFCGREVATARPYDVDAARRLLCVSEGLWNAVWELGRMGCLCVGGF